MKNKIAKMFRVITVPPLLITLLLIMLYFLRHDLFDKNWYLLWLITLLGIVPVLAYPLQRVLPKWKKEGREGQRQLAFVLSLIGYTIAMTGGYLQHMNSELQMIANTYFFSVVLLTISNKLLKIRASGHACSVTGPLVFLVYFVDWRFIVVSILVGAAVVWSSLVLKRHTAKELTFGASICIVAFGISRILYMI